MKKLIILGSIAFTLGYVIASWFILEGGGLSKIDVKKLVYEKIEVERKLNIFHALNPFEPMSIGIYMMMEANP